MYIRVCADIAGKKVNLELPFNGVPSIGELTRRIDDVFSSEMRVLQPGFGERFLTTKMQVYDDRHLKWVDLLSSDQITTDRCQVYAFKENGGSPVRDIQQEMPAPRAPSASSVPYHSSSPQRSVGGYSPGGSYQHVSPLSSEWRVGKERPQVPFQDKIDTTFQDFNHSRSGSISHGELTNGFKTVDIDFTAGTLDELFVKADRNQDQRLTPEEWRAWCGVYPNTLDCVYFRGRDRVEEEEVNRASRRIQDDLVQAESREQQLRRELDEIQARKADGQRQMEVFRQRQAAFQQRRDTLEQQERDLMEQEIRLERQRDHLRTQEHRFNVAAHKFDQATAVCTKRICRQWCALYRAIVYTLEVPNLHLILGKITPGIMLELFH